VTQVIKEAKHVHYNKQLLSSSDKVDAIRRFVKMETGKYSRVQLST
jgi:hypothetical protein